LVNAPAITWQQTPDRRTWRAARGSVLLTVTKLTNGMFRADVEGLAKHSPECRTRLAAQTWAENHAGDAA
jgi:hypothetical protein